MNGGILQPALRQLRTRLRDPATWAVLGGVSLVMGVSGPFDTFSMLALPARLAYWAVVVPSTYSAALLGGAMAQQALPRLAPLPALLLTSLASAMAVSLLLIALNTALGFPQTDATDLATSFAAILAICLAIEGLGRFIAARAAPQVPTPTQAPILNRLPLDKRGPLIRLQMQDHYVEVVTTQGRALVLMRMGDAIAECAPVPGFHSHRSHWVALDQVARTRRLGDAHVLTLHSGAEVPLARSRIKAAMAAGLLPSRGPQG